MTIEKLVEILKNLRKEGNERFEAQDEAEAWAIEEFQKQFPDFGGDDWNYIYQRSCL